MQRINFIRNPRPSAVGQTVDEFLRYLGGPACLHIEGRDSSRCRAVVTLLHGNEPSGTIALHRWLRLGIQPSVNIVCIVAAVHTARLEPLFNYRQIPGQRDLNRCFKPPFDDMPGVLAAEILEILKLHEPECVIDMHNTSGSGPAFAVANFMDWRHEALAAIFTDCLILTHLRLGALMEISDQQTPTVTIEVGGREDTSAHELAFEGLCRYFEVEQPLKPLQASDALDIYTNPVRVELAAGVTLDYRESASVQCDLTLRDDIERFNTGVTPAHTLLGWVGELETSAFTALDAHGVCTASDLIYISNRELRTRQDLRMFMITTSVAIATSDCLFYTVSADSSLVSATPG